ncbi:MAG: hypothetical protein ACR2GD_01415 [Pyrinomonadaceae bacterium]
MVTKLTVIFFILLCLMVGTFLILLPWLSLNGVGDWGDNYLLILIAQKIGIPALQKAVASAWVRGAVTGLGLLNLLMAFWEIANFSRGVKTLEQENSGVKNNL